MEVTQAIIDKIKRNRISSTEVADCMNKTGNISTVHPINRGHFRVGEVFWAYAFNESNWELHKQLRGAGKGNIVFVETFDCADRAVFGELVSKFLLLYRQASGIVIQGYLRDIPHLIKENWPIWCTGGTPIGCFNRQNEQPLDEKVVARHRKRYEGAIAVCDDSGVVIITAEYITASFLDKLDSIECQEDVWFDCIDRLKWDTYDTVCLKKYRDPPTKTK